MDERLSVYAATCLTPGIVAQNTGFLDWSTQPSSFKRYPEFLFRYRLKEVEALAWLDCLRCITATQTIAKRPYRRLNTPSAGNLHPIELYAQVRGVKGVIEGIYHIDALRRELVLLQEIGKDGLEPCFDLPARFQGIIIIIALVPFRSWWKYGMRAWRYLYLDAGHQVAAVSAAAALHERQVHALNPGSAGELNRLMGFEEKEFVLGALAWGQPSSRSVEALPPVLMHVDPTDYSEPFLQLKESLTCKVALDDSVLKLPGAVKIDALQSALLARRSARLFAPRPLAEGLFEKLENCMDTVGVNGTLVLLRDQVRPGGMYREGKSVKAGFFAEEMAVFLMGQRFVALASAFVVVHAPVQNAAAHVAAGIAGHWLYLLCEQEGWACSGIGAYYDAALQRFLEVEESILYVIAIGGKP